MTRKFERKDFAVLVVEDDPLLLLDAVDMLEDEGFRVYPARNAATAIRLLERHDHIRILFTDVDMPGSMDGLKLAHAVKDRWPPVRIVVTSGLPHVTQTDVPSEGLFFSKPYPPASVVAALSRISDETFS